MGGGGGGEGGAEEEEEVGRQGFVGSRGGSRGQKS